MRTQVIEGSIAALRRLYVFPDVAAKLETLLRDRARAGAYNRITSAKALADQLTNDLQSVSHDKHMRMRHSAKPVPDDPPLNAPPSDANKADMRRMARQLNAGFVKVERLDGNIGYLRLDYFLHGDDVGPRAAAAMTLLATTDALILDLRQNHGGDPATVALIVSYLYDAYAEVHINDIYDRPTDSTRQFWTLSALPGPRYADKPVYVLTSGQTFSGGEECAYDLQTLKRATLIGEVTGGGANAGGPVKVGTHFSLFVPTGRAVNPVTKTNWEGVGVKPDIATTAAQAFDTAYLQALRAQRKRITAQDAPHLSREIDQALRTLSRTP
ncbi:MAG: S41 family peptidase [Myxococcales bacterium]|nr:S41 family peptidase [Myxococcales bacterium]